MYQKILVPMDGSENAECVIEHVKTIATGCKVTEVVLLRVIEPFPVYIMDYRVDENIIRQAQDGAKDAATESLNKVANQMKKEGLSVTTDVTEGNAAIMILDYAAKNAVDLIIMATHGRTGLSHAMFGSTAEKVVRKAPCPVLSIKHPEHEFVMP